MKNQWVRGILAAAVLWWGGMGCQKAPVGETEAPQEETVAADVPALQEPAERQEYQVKGVVREVMAQEKKVRIRHEEIPNYMPAMTMPFDVLDVAELEGLKPGDEVTFTMVITKEDGWIEGVRKTGQTSEIVTDVPSNFRLVRDVEPLEEGDMMPDYTFTNEVGRVVQLSDYRGRALALTFVFTRCPYPDYCPRMSQNMSAVHTALKARPDGPYNWHLFSITIDPDFDTPAVMKAYAQNYGYDPERWNFLTGPLIDITAITEQFGLQFYRPEPDKPLELTHNLRTVVIDAAGKVQKIFLGNEWKPEEVVEEMLRAAAAPPLPSEGN